MIIIGDVYKFAILVAYMPDWNVNAVPWNNEGSSGNGILLYSIDGHLFPSEILTTPLGTDLNYLVTQESFKPPINLNYFYMNKEDAFKSMLFLARPMYVDITSENEFDEMYFLEMPTANAEANCYFFYVSDGSKVRILGAKLHENDELGGAFYNQKEKPVEIYEAILSIQEFQSLLDGLIAFYEKGSGRKFHI